MNNLAETRNRRLYLLVVSAVFVFTTIYYAGTIFSYPLNSGYGEFLITAYVPFIFLILYLLLLRPFSLIDPPLLLAVSYFLGVVLKAPFLVRDPRWMSEAIFRWDVELLSEGNVLISLSVAAFLLFYTPLGATGRPSSSAVPAAWMTQRFKFVALALVTLTVAAAILAINEIGWREVLANPSQKRFLELDTLSSRIGTSLYFYFKIAISAKVIAYVTIAYLLTRPARDKSTLLGILIFLAAATSIIIPFVFNARAHAVLFIIDAFAIYMMTGRQIRLRYLIAAAVAAYGLFVLINMFRGGVQDEEVLSSLLARRYFMDVMKTSHLLAYLRETGGYLHGETLVGWMFVAVPGSIMPDKPMFVEMAKWIGTEIYGLEVSAVPPGYVGELILNFGYAGAIVGMAISGLAMGLFWRWFLQHKHSPAVLVFGSLVAVRFGIFLFNSDFGTFVIKVILEAIPAALLVSMLVTTRHRKRLTGAILHQS